jgi:hypothetical protein
MKTTNHSVTPATGCDLAQDYVAGDVAEVLNRIYISLD